MAILKTTVTKDSEREYYFDLDIQNQAGSRFNVSGSEIGIHVRLQNDDMDYINNTVCVPDKGQSNVDFALEVIGEVFKNNPAFLIPGFSDDEDKSQ